MTGIEQLRRLARSQNMDNAWTAMLSHELCDIADQIENEVEEQSARLYDMRLGEETDVCELFGVEPVDDPLTSLRRHVENLNDVIENLRLELGEARDPAADVSMSAYDLLPQKDREAIAWVREHGGLERVKAQRRESIPRAAYERKRAGFLRHIAECERALRRRNERIAELERKLDELDDICDGKSVKDTLEEALNLCATIGCEPSSAVGEELIWALGECTDIVSKRLMPEGMELEGNVLKIRTAKNVDYDGETLFVLIGGSDE